MVGDRRLSVAILLGREDISGAQVNAVQEGESGACLERPLEGLQDDSQV